MFNGYQYSIADLTSLANTLGVCRRWLWTELTQPQPFEPLFERVEVRQQQDGYQQRSPLVDLDRAIEDLSTRLQSLRPLHQPDTLESELLDQPQWR